MRLVKNIIFQTKIWMILFLKIIAITLLQITIERDLMFYKFSKIMTIL